MLSRSHVATHKIYCTLMARYSEIIQGELLFCNLLFKFTLMVPVSSGSLGNILTVFIISAGTLTTLPLIFNCFPLGASMSF